MKENCLRGTPSEGRKFSIDYDKELNPQQLEVVRAGDGPILVIAGAGSGKTRTLIYRVARLLESGVQPESLLLLTFTNKAAKEMLRRVEVLLKQDISKLWGGTFHHVANRILHRHAKKIGFACDYTILDRDDSKSLMDDCVTSVFGKDKPKRFPKGSVLVDVCSYAVNTQQTIWNVVSTRFPHLIEASEELQNVIREYNNRKIKQSYMDFDDLLKYWKMLLEDDQEVLEFYSAKFSHILVDEYQDTSAVQGDIVDMLAKKRRNLMVVGDDAQSIYSFRGASFKNIIQFPDRYEDAKVFRLETNYRSTPQILALANSSIARNMAQFGKKLSAVKKDDSKPVVAHSQNTSDQARFVASSIQELVGRGLNYSDIAVLYRAHWHSMEVQMELQKLQIPYEVRSGLKFFEQAHLKDVLSYLKITVNSKDELSWKRLLRQVPRVGQVSAARIWHHLSTSDDPLKAIRSGELSKLIPRGADKALQELSVVMDAITAPGMAEKPDKMIEAVLEMSYKWYIEVSFTNASERFKDIEHVAVFARQFQSTAVFLNELSLLTTAAGENLSDGSSKAQGETVTLTTVHQAKGLEWKAVFVIWLCDGKFPDDKCLKSSAEEEEERRLFYVAVTRAKDMLYLVRPLFAQDLYWDVVNRPSRFIEELGKDCYEEWVSR